MAFLIVLTSCKRRIDLKRLLPPPSRDKDITFFGEDQSLTLAWGNFEGRKSSKFFAEDPFHIGYIRETSGKYYDLILANYLPEDLIIQLVKDVFQSQGIHFGEAPYQIEGELVNFLIDGYQEISCHIVLKLRVLDKKNRKILWQKFYETKSSKPYFGRKLGLQEIHQDVVNQAVEMLEDKLREEDYLSETKHQIYLRKIKSNLIKDQ
jgi:hypothetical protein